jgi:hypothetical protein
VRFGLLREAKLAYCLVALSLLSGCNTYGNVNTKPEASVETVGQGQGIAFLSMIEMDARFTYKGFDCWYRNRADKKVGWLVLTTGMFATYREFTLAEGTGKGALESKSLPAGEYEIVYCKMSVSDGMGGDVAWNTGDFFSIPFSVKPGRAAYLGEIRLVPKQKRGFFGNQVWDGGVFELRDSASRDVALFREKFPNFDPSAIDIVPPRQGTGVPIDMVVFR